MLRFYYLGVVFLSILGVLGSIAILPNEEELALMYYQDHQYSNALELYEKKWLGGDQSISVLSILTKLYVQYGLIEKAIRIMENYLLRHPIRIEERILLGKYYQYAQRPDDYLQNLEKISIIRPNLAILEELSKIYNFKGYYQLQIKTIQKILANYPPDKNHYIQLAYLFAAQKKFAESVQSIRSLLNRFSNQLSDEILDLSISILIDTNNVDEAFEYATSYIKRRVSSAIYLASRFQVKGQTLLAYRLLLPFENLIGKKPELLYEIVSYEITLKKYNRAFQRLYPLFKADKLPSITILLFIELIAYQDSSHYLKEAILKLPLEYLPQNTLVEFAMSIARNNYSQLLPYYKNKLPNKTLQKNPLLDLILTIPNHGKAVSKKASIVLNDTNISDLQKLNLSFLFHQFKKDSWAKSYLLSIEDLKNIKKPNIYAIIQLYLEVNLLKEAQAAFSFYFNKKENKKSASYSILKIALDIASGKIKTVKQWLKRSKKHDEQFLTDLYYLAERYKRSEVGILISTYLYQNFPNERSLLLRLNAYHIGWKRPFLRSLNKKMKEQIIQHLEKLSNKNELLWFSDYQLFLKEFAYEKKWKALLVKKAKNAKKAV